MKDEYKGFHIVNITTETDNLSGNCKGKASISLRAKGIDDEKINKLKADLANKGVKVTEHCEDNGLKSNYENTAGLKWNDIKLKAKPKSSSSCAREKKLENLESSFGIVGNVGKWSQEWKKNSTKNPIDPQLIEQFKWQKTKKTQVK